MSSIVRFASHLRRRTRETTEIVSGSSSFGARLCPTNSERHVARAERILIWRSVPIR